MPSVMIVVEATGGGTGRHVVDLALGCHRRRLQMHLVCATRRDAGFRGTLLELRRAGVAVDEVDMRREIHPLRDGAAALGLRRLIARAEPDVLHLHSSKAGALGRAAVVGLGRRRPAVVYTPHAYAFTAQAGVLNRYAYWCVERALLPWTDRVVAVSESEGRTASRLGARDRVVVIANGVDAPVGVAERPGDRAALRIGWLGRLSWQKDPEAAVKASFVLSELGVDHQLLLGGDGSDRRRVLAAIRGLEAEASIQLLGFVHDTDAFHADIDVLLMTSRSEGLPYVGLDAMARGVPIVGFAVPGIQDLVDHGVTGLLAAPRDVGALAVHLARLARDVELRRALGAAARARVLTHFRREDQIDRMCSLYGTLAAARTASVTRGLEGGGHAFLRH